MLNYFNLLASLRTFRNPPECFDIWHDIFVNCNWVDTRWQ